MAVACGESEIPVIDLETASGPLIRPREDKYSRAPVLEDGPDLPVQDLGLRERAVAAAIQPNLSHQQRAVAGQILQPGEIRAKLVAALQIYIERNEIQEVELEIFRRREIDVGDKGFR